MLKNIHFDLLKTKTRPTGQINFHKGLNVILGSKIGSTSIGKSTALLIIDYAFGGNTYAKSDAVKELGNHTVYFSFSFDEKDYYFARATDASSTIAILNEKEEIIKTIPIEDFTNWLSKKYSMDFEGLSFRNTLSRFFRIYGKNNYSELRPLQTRGGNESQKDAIKVLVALFNFYSEIKAFEDQIKKAEEKISAYRNARKYDFIPSAVDNQSRYKENLATINELKRKKEELEKSSNSDINSYEVEKANEIQALKIQLHDTRLLLKQKESELHLINLNIDEGVYPTDADLKSRYDDTRQKSTVFVKIYLKLFSFIV